MAGVAAQEAGDPGEAVAHFERALSLAPSLIDVRLLLAFAQGANGEAEAARKTLNRTPEISTLPSSDLRRLADAAIQLGAVQTALKIVRLLVEQNSTDAALPNSALAVWRPRLNSDSSTTSSCSSVAV